MRISNQMTNEMLSKSIMGNQSAVYLKEQQISSGKRVQKASDDPSSWVRICQLRDTQSQLTQYARNAQLLESRLLVTDQVLDSIGGVLQNASELTVQASDGTLADEDRIALATEMDELLEQLVMLANSPSAGGYTFGGVLSANEPFAVTRDVEGRVELVAYVGGTSQAMVEIAEGDTLPGQLVGGDPDSGVLISSTSDAFATLIEMRDRLLAGENLADTNLQEQVDTAFEEVLAGRASVGACLEHVAFVDALRMNQEVLLMEDLTAAEGIDMARAVTELSEMQTAYEASLAMASEILSVSLLNYL